MLLGEPAMDIKVKSFCSDTYAHCYDGFNPFNTKATALLLL